MYIFVLGEMLVKDGKKYVCAVFAEEYLGI
jgi:hypothetical protein